MNFRLWALRLYVPLRMRLTKLQALLEAAAYGFEKPVPTLEGLTFSQALKTFATFTHTSADECFTFRQNLAPVLARLTQATRNLGGDLRRELHITQREDALTALEVLYSALGIQWHTTKDGTVTVRNCRFSSLYTPKICELMSAMDRGLVDGITDGGQLVWKARITEGHPSCQGHIEFP